MTSPSSPNQTLAAPTAATDSPDACPVAATDTATVAEPVASKKTDIPAFAFPFSPGAFAPGKKDDQPWHQKGNASSHNKKIGQTPSGTRRSMGKR